MSARLRCLVVDDEALAREALRNHLAHEPEVLLAGEARDGPEALERLEEGGADLLFLDVQMPEMDGFAVLAEATARGLALPAVVFVTAHDRHALRAFEVHALDYLLKPIREARLHDAIAAARARLLRNTPSGAPEVAALLADLGLAGARPRRLAVKTGGRITFVDPAEVEWIEAEGNYVRLHLAGRSCLVRETLTEMEARLDPARFMRIHRSVIVGIDRIRDLRPWFTGEYVVRLDSGREFTLTRRYRENLRRLIGRRPA
ncbi:MAG TPA: LytTR family DNA-binding domain-containing protein [Candidatus Polarisedimenticolia bacterium]|nr:LytTR family DNA-binding domain-containing protein [Candidatus Polarisedimenticolia bacterium]